MDLLGEVANGQGGHASTFVILYAMLAGWQICSHAVPCYRRYRRHASARGPHQTNTRAAEPGSGGALEPDCYLLRTCDPAKAKTLRTCGRLPQISSEPAPSHRP